MRLPFVLSVAASLIWTAGCSRQSDLPAVGSTQYRDLCSAFYLGLSALQSGEDVNARKGLTRATEIAPGEPAGWANLGLLQFRQQDYEGAFQSVGKAQTLAPANSRLEALLGVIESRRGKPTESLGHLQRAVSLDGANLKALYSLAGETERQNSAETDTAAQKLLAQIVRLEPNNIAVLVDLVRLSAKRNDAPALHSAIAHLAASAPLWPDAARQQLTLLEGQASGSNVRSAAVQAQFLRNVLVRVPAYRQSLDEVKTPVTAAGEPFLRFLKLPSPSSDPSPSDRTLSFSAQPLSNVPSAPVQWIGAFFPDDQAASQIIWVQDNCLHLPGNVQLPLPAAHAPLGPHAILAADLNYDFKNDLVIAADTGLRIYRQTNAGKFEDITAKSSLPSAVLNRNYTGAWAFDIEGDGDLDIVLGVPAGAPVVLRNNGDGTFKPIQPFKDVDGLIDFASADIDGDGDADVALLDKNGQLKVFANERLGDYRPRPVPPALQTRSLRLAAADVNGDGLPDFVVLHADGHVMRLSDVAAGHDWSFAEIAAARSSEQPSLTLADLDNNGGLDLIVGDQVFLSDAHGFTPLPTRLPASAQAVAEANESERLKLLALSADGKPTELISHGSKQYHWQDVRPKAATTHGDQRINSFGIGGEIEIRADLLTEKQIITAPVLHFGIGDHSSAEFARIAWPNGIIQTEFYPKADATLLAEQRLKGSCPLLFAWNGHAVEYLKDVAPMSGALGAHDGSGKIADITQTEEWFKINGDQLQPHDGFYDVRVTDEYWEAYYIDRYSLRTVDHAPGTQIFADERVATPPAPLKIYVTGPSHPFASARDDHGQDVSNLVNQLDNRYLDTFQLGAYQGIAQDHWVELALPDDAPRSGLYLIAQGWLHPWDDSVLVAVNQGSQPKPQDLSIEVPDRNGRWITAQDGLGVPAGREKTVVLDLSKVFQPGAPRRLRLRTNLEIYWDRLTWAAAAPNSLANAETLPLSSADLHRRGFSLITQRNARAPETPDYNQLAATGEKWRSIEGYYTRYGDVLPLLQASDDRFVMMKSGDELAMKFRAAASPLPAGWSRDYIFIGDGWMKEGDGSFEYSATLLPLPSHKMKHYPSPARSLEDDPAYRAHVTDWQSYHTRYVGPAELAKLK